MRSAPDKLVSRYLRNLRADLSGLPAARRDEIADATARRIAAGRATLPNGGTEAEVGTLLAAVGDPADIAADAWRPYGFVRPAPRRELTAIVLVTIGGCAFIVGWVVGVVMLWRSAAWTTADKLVGTLILPLGLTVPLGLLMYDISSGTSPEVCDPAGYHCRKIEGVHASHPIPLGVIAILIAVQLAATAYLALRLRARPAPEPAVP